MQGWRKGVGGRGGRVGEGRSRQTMTRASTTSWPRLEPRAHFSIDRPDAANEPDFEGTRRGLFAEGSRLQAPKIADRAQGLDAPTAGPAAQAPMLAQQQHVSLQEPQGKGRTMRFTHCPGELAHHIFFHEARSKPWVMTRLHHLHENVAEVVCFWPQLKVTFVLLLAVGGQGRIRVQEGLAGPVERRGLRLGKPHAGLIQNAEAAGQPPDASAPEPTPPRATASARAQLGQEVDQHL